jgi:hypothetical protein
MPTITLTRKRATTTRAATIGHPVCTFDPPPLAAGHGSALCIQLVQLIFRAASMYFQSPKSHLCIPDLDANEDLILSSIARAIHVQNIRLTPFCSPIRLSSFNSTTLSRRWELSSEVTRPHVRPTPNTCKSPLRSSSSVL